MNPKVESALRFLYPVLPIGGHDVVFHNFVALLITFAVSLVTLMNSLDQSDDRMLGASKIVHVSFLLLATLAAGVVLAMPSAHATQVGLDRLVSLLTFAAALLTVVFALTVVTARLETGVNYYLEFALALFTMALVWRAGHQTVTAST